MSLPQQLLAVGIAPVGDVLLVAAVDHVHLGELPGVRGEHRGQEVPVREVEVLQVLPLPVGRQVQGGLDAAVVVLLGEHRPDGGIVG